MCLPGDCYLRAKHRAYISLFILTTLGGSYYYYAHFVSEETGTEKFISGLFSDSQFLSSIITISSVSLAKKFRTVLDSPFPFSFSRVSPQLSVSLSQQRWALRSVMQTWCFPKLHYLWIRLLSAFPQREASERRGVCLLSARSLCLCPSFSPFSLSLCLSLCLSVCACVSVSLVPAAAPITQDRVNGCEWWILWTDEDFISV